MGQPNNQQDKFDGFGDFEKQISASAITTAADLAVGGKVLQGGAISGAAVGGYVSGQPQLGAAVGRFVAGMGFTASTKYYANKLVGIDKPLISEEQMQVLVDLSKGKQPRMDIALAMAVGAVSQIAFNYYTMPNQAAWYGPSIDRQDLLAQMTFSQRTLYEQATQANPLFRGEISVEGIPGSLGSWQTYLMRMIMLDETYAKQALAPIINSTNESMAHNQMAWQMVLDFWHGLRPNLLKDSFLTAAKAGATMYGLRKLWDSLYPEKPKKKQKKPVARRQGSSRRRTRRLKRVSAGTRDTLLALFRRLDKDKSGTLQVEEVGRLARRFGLDPPSLMRMFDKNANGEVGFDEFAKFMRQRSTEL